MQYTVKKPINNNILRVVDPTGCELIVTGRGLGFGVKPGYKIEAETVERSYRMTSPAVQQKLVELLEQIPYEHLLLTDELVAMIRSRVNYPLNESLLITLADHISFAIQRSEQGIRFSNPLMAPIREFYPEEYLLGMECLAAIRQRCHADLSDDEGGFIALHIVNAELNTTMSVVNDVTRFVDGCVQVVEYFYNCHFDRDALDFSRFTVHLRFFAQRVFQGKQEVYPQKEADGDLYHGLSRKLTFDRMIPPHGLEVTYDKTVHVIFPAEVRYVDLGSPDLIAGKADGAENIIRVKATVRNFPNETNMSVITEDGSFYTFNVKYAAEPLLLNVEMCDFIHDGSTVNRPNNAQEIYLKELGSESPMLVRLIMKSIHKQNKREVKHIGCKRFGIQYLLKGIYTHNGLLYFHTEIKNQSNVPFDVDYITWKIVDKKVAKRTAVQEQIILPLRAQNYATLVPGKKSERTVFTMAKFTIPDDKCLVVELNEKNGGRHQSFVIENEDLVRAGTINELQVR